MINKFACLLLLVSLVSCGTPDVPRVQNSGIVGAWRWTGTYGGITGQMAVTPQSTGEDVLLELGDDAHYAVFSNGTQWQSGTYQLGLEESIYTHEEATYITFSVSGEGEAGSERTANGVFDGIIGTNGRDTLTISDNHYDGVGSVFVRN